MSVDAARYGVDLAALAGWLRREGVAAGPVEVVEAISGGTQNVLLRLRAGGADYVLRRPPVHKKPRDDDTMRREMRLLAALAGTDVPHPAYVAGCADPAVLGAAFYLMAPLDGANPNVALPPGYVAEPRWRHQLGLEVAATAARVGDVDYAAIGLADFGRAEGYLDRQVTRWLRQLESYRELAGYPPDRRPPHVDEIGRWLADRKPAAFTPGLIHGDFHLANVMVAHDRPEVIGVIDWELSTLGDPLIDLGWLLATWPDGDPRAPGVKGAEPWDGFPTPAELVESYARTTTRPVGHVEWYTVLACFKLGVILEGTYARARAGLAPAPLGERFRQASRNALSRAWSIVDG
ncbi:phosphotransferase family protein [Pseudofrankia inefficax]|uniref:Aminoglycoside phosphotransferase n=1 Tax=Pseudofrankia inefficax (strain DSM 45817 / CECT 9037 / DDB 130130 / EuI1c) TaxID=298654 RepID=E3IU49_PSEI1|nr:phosphotransferase family protein [Pseudofrankia inefficax]ADP81242.1 aminoglycoside phosphotransferase [Pseudofrankia inefficax]